MDNYYFRSDKIFDPTKYWNTHEARGVVVTGGLGVTEGLQDGVGLDNLVLQGTLLQARTVHTRSILRDTYRAGVEPVLKNKRDIIVPKG